jgi:tight adherence protein C
MPLMVALAVFVFGFATIAALYLGLAERSNELRPGTASISRYTGSARNVLARSSLEIGGRAGRILSWWIWMTGNANENAPRARETSLALSRAGFNHAEEFAIFRAARVLSLALAIIIGLALAHLYPRWQVAALLGGGIVGYVLPDRVLRSLVKRRQLTIIRELPAVLDLMVVTLEAGQGLHEAIRVVGRETSRQGRQLGRELATAAAEMSAGISLEDSMQHLADRTGIDEIKSVAAVITQSKELGGRLGPSLRAAGELLNTKRQLKAEEAAQKNSVKMLLPLVLLILPAMMLIILGPAIIEIFRMIMGASA